MCQYMSVFISFGEFLGPISVFDICPVIIGRNICSTHKKCQWTWHLFYSHRPNTPIYHLRSLNQNWRRGYYSYKCILDEARLQRSDRESLLASQARLEEPFDGFVEVGEQLDWIKSEYGKMSKGTPNTCGWGFSTETPLLRITTPRYEPSYWSISMVVMEYVDGDTFVVAKQKISEESIERVRSAVRRALELLHRHGLVFGQNRHNSISHSQYLCRLDIKGPSLF